MLLEPSDRSSCVHIFVRSLQQWGVTKISSFAELECFSLCSHQKVGTKNPKFTGSHTRQVSGPVTNYCPLRRPLVCAAIRPGERRISDRFGSGYLGDPV